MEPITSKIPLMVIEGNHEIEPQGHGGEVKFASYFARFAVPSKESGSNTKFYYSFNAGGIHFIMLGAYVDYNRTGNNSFTTISFPFDCIYSIQIEAMYYQTPWRKQESSQFFLLLTV
jgi:hypothetical protein